MKLDKWQSDVMYCRTNICLRSGRQVGKSTVISCLAAEYAIANRGKTIMIIAAVERQAYLLFEKVLAYIEDVDPGKIAKKKDKPTKTRIKLINGSTIYCLPTGLTGYGIRGFTIDLLIADEAAFIPDDVFAAVTPSIAARKNARIILLSTPHGRNNYFARAFNDPTFTTFHVSSEDCPRISKAFLESERKRMSKREYAQEYLGEFVDELMQFFPEQLIKQSMFLKRRERNKKLPAFMGVDIARMGEDESTYEILERLPDGRLAQIENIIAKKTQLFDNAQYIMQLDRQYNISKVLIDDEGIGIGVYDFLIRQDQVKRKLIPLNNSKRVLDKDGKKTTKLLKEDLYNHLLMLMESKQIGLLDDEEIYLSLKSVQYEYTTDKLGRSHLHIFGSYTHIAEGLIRAAWGISGKSLNIWISSIKV